MRDELLALASGLTDAAELLRTLVDARDGSSEPMTATRTNANERLH
jgi:hypothetical protein